ncbi:MAG: hypothetical protein PCFJNLEI_03916 [Verrucomicrobiae bacterium]|nr:hypothetical protein [Verrucomicrobiae bacterium]
MIPLVANSLWFASCLPEAAAFLRATRNVAGTQRLVLRRITGCEVEEFLERFPLTDEIGEPHEPVVRRLPTSGTTGPTKWIPYTASLYQEFQRGIAPWIVDLFSHNPGMLAGKSYWAISPVGETGAEFGDDTEYLGSARKWVAATLAVPASVRLAKEWRQETLCHLLACRDLTFISVWHPSFLTLLLEGVEPDWPKLRVISCWDDAPELREKLPQATIQPKGLIATEGFVSLPLWGREGAALALRSHFFEFLDGAGKSWLAHELVAGREYSVVLTTSGGLKRYRLNDRILVTGFECECPLLRFVGKETNVSDRFGEKVSELQVAAALVGLSAEFVLVACEGRAYTLFAETEMADETLEVWAEKLEMALRENVHYRYCRELGQLEPVQAFRIVTGGAATYLAVCQARGQRLGDVKPVWLSRQDGWVEHFKGRRLRELAAVKT